MRPPFQVFCPRLDLSPLVQPVDKLCQPFDRDRVVGSGIDGSCWLPAVLSGVLKCPGIFSETVLHCLSNSKNILPSQQYFFCFEGVDLYAHPAEPVNCIASKLTCPRTPSRKSHTLKIGIWQQNRDEQQCLNVQLATNTSQTEQLISDLNCFLFFDFLKKLI